MEQVQRTNLELITRRVTAVLEEENLSFIHVEVSPIDKDYILSLIAQLFGETKSEFNKVEVPWSWLDHLYLTLSQYKLFSALKGRVRYNTITTRTEITVIDPAFTQSYGHILQNTSVELEED